MHFQRTRVRWQIRLSWRVWRALRLRYTRFLYNQRLVLNLFLIFLEYSKSCSQLTGNFGRFSSAPVTPPNENIHKNHWMNLVRKSVVLITVQANHTIWLAFNKFRTTENRFLKVNSAQVFNYLWISEKFILIKVYDGSYSTSPLLLSHSGTTKPHPVRSSSNNLYVEFPSYYDQRYGVEVFYTSVSPIMN
jgi:hypothetical protein